MASPSDTVVLKLNEQNLCSVHLFGATLISWRCDGEEMIFVSKNSHYDNKKAIRGGIPLVFPNFGPWDLGPQHGFARINKWTGTTQPQASDGSVQAIFELQDSELTRQMWDYKFKLQYVVTLTANSLSTQFIVDNKGDKAFDFTCLLHTYFSVPNVEQVTVSGLNGLTYTDKVAGGQQAVEDRTLVTVNSNVDRVYENTGNEHVISNAAGGKNIILTKENLPDTVVWNPWKEKAAGMSDFGDEEYPFMICVEAGHVAQRKQLGPGETFKCGQVMQAKL